MMGEDTYDEWEKDYKDKHGITLQKIQYHKKYRFGNDQICTATEGVVISIMLGKYRGAICACLVPGAASLLMSKNSAVELKTSPRAFESELDLPKQDLRLPLARAGGEHFLLQLGNFRNRGVSLPAGHCARKRSRWIPVPVSSASPPSTSAL